MNARNKRIITLLLVAAGFFTIWYFNLTQYMSLDWIKTNREYLRAMVHEHYWYAVAAYITFYIVATTFALPATFVVTIAGGFLFNVFPGVFFVNIGATLGAVGAFLASRYVVGTWVQQRYAQQLKNINQKINEFGSYYLIVSRLIVVLPFFLVNLLAGLTNVSIATFMWTTSLGILPATLVYTFMGRELMHITSRQDLMSWRMILAFILLAALLIVPLLLYTNNKKKKNK